MPEPRPGTATMDTRKASVQKNAPQGPAPSNKKRSRAAAIVALFLLIYIPSSFNWFSGGAISTDILRDGALYEALHTEAIVIRNEELLYSPAYGYSIPAVNEAERVPGNSVVATVYNSFSYELMEEFNRINHELLKEQYEVFGRSNVFLQEVDSIEKDVTGVVRKMIPDINRNSLNEASARTDSVNALLVKRAEAYGALATDDPYIKQLKEEKRSIEGEVAEGSMRIYSGSPGYLSFILDGLEPELTLDSVGSLSWERCEEIIATSQSTNFVPPSDAYGSIAVAGGEPFAKIVRDNAFFLLVKAPDDYQGSFSIGDKVRLRTESPYLEIENAEIWQELPDGMFAIRVNKYLFDFLGVRTVNVALVEKYVEGLKIPLKCLRDIDLENGVASVALLKGSYASIRRVRVLASNDIYAIIESYDGASSDGRVGRYDTYIRDAANIEDGMPLSK